MKAIAYMRVSSASQIEGDGFKRQLEAITTFANNHNFELVGTYREEGISGKTELDGRPAFMSMLADLLSNGCRTIIVERLDRLAREYRIQEELLMYLMRHSLVLISADTGEDITAAMASDPMRKFIVQLQGLLAELDKSLLVAKLKKARANVRARGGFQGGNRPYGYGDEKEQVTAGWIRTLRSEGLTYEAIRQTLVTQGIQTRKGTQWQISTIRAICLSKQINPGN